MLTALGDNPRPENNLEKEVVNPTLGLSSATTTHVRTQLKLMPLCCTFKNKYINYKLYKINRGNVCIYIETEQQTLIQSTENTNITF